MSSFHFDQLGLPAEIETELVRLSASYEFLKLSEKGQNGYLFVARNKVLDRPVAIKFYYWADGYRAHVEPRSLSGVISPSIIEVLEASVVGDEWALFVTPFCLNGDLDRFREMNRFGLRDALRFTSELLDGVATLHEKGYVHRDLKPENILVSDSRSPLIADFGSVRLIPEGEIDVPGSGHAVLYRPPESFENNRYDKRGDIYQSGIVLYQTLGGRLSYSGLDYLTPGRMNEYEAETDLFSRSKLIEDSIKERVLAGKLLDLSSLPFFVPSRVKQIIRRATNTALAERYSSASAMMADINHASGTVLNWQYEDNEPVAHVGKVRYRLSPGTARGRYVVQQNHGSGWRKVPGSSDNTLAQQLRVIRQR